MQLSGAVLAGGKSSRMGRDKSLLPAGGGALWQRQLAVLGGAGVRDPFLIGGPPDVPHIADAFPGAGPLGGIATALRHAGRGLVLVLAVDMPAMTADCLCALAAIAAGDCGVVPIVNGRIEPLAAIYPAAAAPIAAGCIASGRLAVREFIADAEKARLLAVVAVPPEFACCFANANTPDEWAELGAAV